MENSITLPAIQSEKTTNLFKALLKAQTELKPVTRDATNPHFRSGYTTYEKVTETFAEIFTPHGLVFHHAVTKDLVITQITHAESGEWIRSFHPIVVDKPGPQPFASGESYAKRYNLMGLTGMASGDDDAETATSRAHSTPYDASPRGRGNDFGDSRTVGLDDLISEVSEGKDISGGSDKAPASEKQMAMLYAVATKECGYSPQGYAKVMFERFGVPPRQPAPWRRVDSILSWFRSNPAEQAG